MQGDIIDSIYFGGGTPGILDVAEVEAILGNIYNTFKIIDGAEITLEANPDDCSPEKLAEWKKIGINRLSIGVQSFDDAELKWMNRAHNASQAISALENIRNTGYENFTADLIYGSPLQRLHSLEKNIDIMLSYRVPHLSCYALTVENKTLLHHLIAQKKSPDVDTDHQAAAFELISTTLEKAGYEHYEISNFARPGFRSKHNSSYWQGKPYLGLGPSAHSYDGKNKRRWNIANNALYIRSLSQNIIPFEDEMLSPSQQLNEYIMTALRTMEGIDLDKISASLSKKGYDDFNRQVKMYLEGGLLNLESNRLMLTNKAKFLADGIAADLFV